MSESKAEQVTVRLTKAEKDTAEELGKYLFKVGKLDAPSIAGALRLSLRYMVNEIAKSIERERYGN